MFYRVHVSLFYLATFTFAGHLSAGQSLNLQRANVTFPDPVARPEMSWRLEFQLHSWKAPSSPANLMVFDGLGPQVQLYPGEVLALGVQGDDDSRREPCQVSVKGIA